MVQEIQPTRLSTEIGNSLSQGLAKGAEFGVQRGMLKNALQDLGNLPKNASAFDLAKALIGATAGIPGAERYVGQLFPLLLNEAQAQQYQQQGQEQGAGASGQFEGAGGYLRPPMTEDQKISYAKRLAGQGVPLEKGIDIANKLSEGSERNLENIQNLLKGQGITDQELPYALQIAQMNPATDPNQILKDTRKSIDEIRQLDDALTPGFLKGATQKVVAGGKALGLIPAWVSGGESREKAINRLQPVIKRLVDKGFDPLVREKLANLGLSRTEVQETIHPLKKELQSKIESFPRSSSSALKNENMISDFVGKNVNPDTSLLVLRHKLWKDKGYDWRQTYDGIVDAVDKGLTLSEDQERELTELSTQPPRDSLLDIFSDYGRLFDIIPGRK